MTTPTSPADLPADIHAPTARLLNRVIGALTHYHAHRVAGMHVIPKTGAALIVIHHSLASYDIVMLAYAIFHATGRYPRALVDRLFFKVPPAGRVIARVGSVEGRPDEGERLLRQGELVMVAPGGMREALRPSAQKYKLSWNNRRGFARLAIQTNVPIIPAACPAADDIFNVRHSRVTQYFLERYHIPVPIFGGLGGTPIPKPVALTHYLGNPILPPNADVNPERAAQQLAEKVAQAVQALLATPR